MHLSIDPEMNVHQIAITEDNVSDEAGLNAMLAVDANVDCVIADGAYYSIAQTEAWSACGVLPVIPPPANAVAFSSSIRRGSGSPRKVVDQIRASAQVGRAENAELDGPGRRGRVHHAARIERMLQC
ncbi:D-aminopeptidase [Paraburkholderia sp. JPY465]